MKKMYERLYREFRLFGDGGGTSYQSSREVIAGESAFDSHVNKDVEFHGWMNSHLWAMWMTKKVLKNAR